MTDYTVNQLARLAGISVRTLHYYDELGILKPATRGENRYRHYGEDAVIRLQQIMFYRELGFSLEEIKEIVSRPDFNVLDALESHREMLQEKAARIDNLLATIDKTIGKIKGENEMQIKEYYEGFSDEQIEKYRQEARQRWGEKTIADSEARVLKMGKKKFAELQARGGEFFKSIADNMAKGHDSPEVQKLVAQWRQWLENFAHYSDEAVLGLGQAYSQHPDFAKFFSKIHKDLPPFLTRAIEHYYSQNK